VGKSLSSPSRISYILSLIHMLWCSSNQYLSCALWQIMFLSILPPCIHYVWLLDYLVYISRMIFTPPGENGGYLFFNGSTNSHLCFRINPSPISSSISVSDCYKTAEADSLAFGVNCDLWNVRSWLIHPISRIGINIKFRKEFSSTQTTISSEGHLYHPTPKHRHSMIN